MKNQRGILMLECVLAIAMLTMLLAITVPGARRWMQGQQEKHIEEQLSNMLFKQRFLAMNRHEAVRWCGSAHGQACDGAWSQGWLLLNESGSRLSFHRVTIKGLGWHAGHLHQHPGILVSDRGRLASSPGHFEWQIGGVRHHLYVSGSGLARPVFTSQR